MRMALAERIAAKSPLAVAGSKLALKYAADHGTAEALQQMTLLQSAIFDIGEMATAIAAWKDKRDGRFRAAARRAAGLTQHPHGTRGVVAPDRSRTAKSELEVVVDHQRRVVLKSAAPGRCARAGRVAAMPGVARW